MTEQEYNQAPGIRRSLLWELRRSPAHLKWRMENPPEATPALIFGQALHAALLAQRVMTALRLWRNDTDSVVIESEDDVDD